MKWEEQEQRLIRFSIVWIKASFYGRLIGFKEFLCDSFDLIHMPLNLQRGSVVARPIHSFPCQWTSRIIPPTLVIKVQSYSTYPWNDDSCNADPYPRSLQQSIPQVNAVPEGHKVPLYLDIVSSVQPVSVVVDDGQNLGINDVWDLALGSDVTAAEYLIGAQEVALRVC